MIYNNLIPSSHLHQIKSTVVLPEGKATVLQHTIPNAYLKEPKAKPKMAWEDDIYWEYQEAPDENQQEPKAS
jgi:hypothetical protein